MNSNNPLKDITLQSSKFSFNADAKNKLIDLELSREVKILERRLGWSTHNINCEMRALRAEIQTIRKSTGNCGEGLASEDDKLLQEGLYWEHQSSKSATSTLNARPHKSGKNPGNNTKLNSRVETSSAGIRGRKLDAASDNEFSRLQTKPDTIKACSATRRKKSTPIGVRDCTKCVAKTTRMNKNNLEAPVDLRPHSVEIGTGITKKHLKIKVKNSEEFQRPYSANDVIVNRRASVTDNLGIVHNLQSEQDNSVKASEDNTEYHQDDIETNAVNIVAKHNSKPRQVWLKSALRDRQQISNATPKKVTIASNGNEQDSGGKIPTTKVNSLFQKPSDEVTLNEQNKPHADGNLLAMFVANFQQNQATFTPNKIPDVRKSKQSKQDVVMKRRRDSLLTASVSRLISKTSVGKAAQLNAQNKSGSQSTEGSLRFRDFVTNKIVPPEQKSTLGTRLVMKSVAETSSSNLSFSRSVKIHNSDSEDEDKPITPRIQPKKVQSKIASKWRRGKASDKPPELERDKEQLKMHLVASRTSRGRDLERIQGENYVDPKKELDAGRQAGVISKVQAFTAFLENKKKEEERRDKAVKLIRNLVIDNMKKRNRGPVSPALQKWRQIARKSIGKE